ncbi:hypothetical protein HZB97_01080 [Candidatus Gottesmanbacteria bacterium]|nr:hypothetical protein [Candidatus Gottesmanbacteria bacterium]MBI5465503.1 hypothetical protein [Candidatus Gottesmanbacteria bacterium]
MEREKDPLQILLIFGLPFYLWVGGLAAIIIGRFLLAAPFFHFGPLAVISLLLVSFISGLIFSYLAFWVFVFLKKKQND